MSPFGIETLPAEALRALRTLPLIAERLQEVVSHTSVLNTITSDVSRISEDVTPLPGVGESVSAIQRDTSTLPEVRAGITALADRIGGLEVQMAALSDATGVLPGMDRRMATIEDAMPVLVEVQRHLAELPETMKHLDTGIAGLTDLLSQLTISLGTLDGNVASLQESMEPVGRLVDKLPGGNRR